MIKKGSLTYFLLMGLEKTIQVQVRLIDFAYNPHLYAYSDYPRKLNYGSLYQAVKDLGEKGFIETVKDEGKVILQLTDRGRQEAVVKKLLEEKTWDGNWRVVIFDIPEKHSKLRRILRSKLREWEFEPWQKSVWAGKKNVTEPLRSFIKSVGLSDWVRILVASDV